MRPQKNFGNYLHVHPRGHGGTPFAFTFGQKKRFLKGNEFHGWFGSSEKELTRLVVKCRAVGPPNGESTQKGAAEYSWFGAFRSNLTFEGTRGTWEQQWRLPEYLCSFFHYLRVSLRTLGPSDTSPLLSNYLVTWKTGFIPGVFRRTK